MALTRKLLKAMNLEDDVIEQIITAHAETVDALKEESEKAKQHVADYDAIKNKLESLEKEDYKSKFEALNKDFESFKQDSEKAKVAESKKKAYTDLLKKIGVGDKQIDKIAGLKDLNTIELNDDGTIKNVEELEKSEKEDWGAFIIKTQTTAKDPDNPLTPPDDNAIDASKISMSDYIRYRKEGKI